MRVVRIVPVHHRRPVAISEPCKMPSNESSCLGPDISMQTTWELDPHTPGFTPRKLRVVCIGAGLSGLTLAYKLKHERPMEFVDLCIYEKNHEVGGTWLDNVYPGVGCDIPAPSYVFPFEPNPDWSKFYVGGAEIQEYILRTTAKYGLRERIVFKTKLLKAEWDDDRAKWKLQLEQDGHVFDDETDVLINGSGCLSQWKWPDIEGLDCFKGKLLHSARWDPEYDWEGKRIAVIGNGSSALQLVPSLQPKAAKLVNYIRHPTWVSVNFCPDLTRDGMGTNFEFTEEEKQQFRDDPEMFYQYRKKVEHGVNSVFQMMISGSDGNKFLHDAVEGLMKQRLSDRPDLIDKLIPDYEIGCRRLSPGDGYLEALQATNARPSFANIKRITPTGIETEEGEEEFDLIACATGFNTSYIPPFKLTGRGGRRLDVEWKDTPSAYFATCAAGIPNYFVFAGPNAPVGHGSVNRLIWSQADYMLNWVEKMATEDIRSVSVKDSAVRDFNLYAKENLKRCVWSKGCHAWYSKKTDGEDNIVTAMYPGSLLHFKVYLDTIRGEHFDIEYNTSNMFGFLGNGELALERGKDADMAFYM